MSWQPFHTLDLIQAGLLPAGWQASILALSDAPERQILDTAPPVGSGDAGYAFSVVEGHVLRERLGWFWALYHGALRAFAAERVGYPLYASNRLRAAITLNILSGADAENAWHVDQNAVTGVFYAAVPDKGGDLLFRDGAVLQAKLKPRPGLFTCFEGATEHHVTPLSGGVRMALPVVYYRSPTVQPPSYGLDVYALDPTEPSSEALRLI